MKLLVLDGNSIFNRAFYGIKLLTTKDGFYTNAIYGFLNILNKLKKDVSPEAVAIAFDMKAPTFRHEKCPSYKENRKGMPQELFMQFPVLKELLSALGYKLVESEGFEADDILGTFAKICEDTNNECIIATGDRDSLQLVSDKVTVRIASTKFGKSEVTIYNEAKILEDYGVSPKQLIDIKALQGDTSDNIKGVPGIGKKGASDLIQKFGSIDYIYDNIENLEIKPAMQKKLIEGKDSAYMSRFLGTIVKNAPIDSFLEDYIPKNADVTTVTNILLKLEMFSLIEKLDLNATNIDQTELTSDITFDVVLDKPLKQLEILIKKSNKADFIVNFKENNILEILFVVDDTIFVVPYSIELEAFLKNILEDSSVIKRTHDSKKLFTYAEKCNIEIKNLAFDTILAAYLLNASAKGYELEKLALEYGISNVKICCDDQYYQEISKNAAFFKILADMFNEKINENNQQSLLCDIEIPLAKVLAQMEILGFKVDFEGLKRYGNFLKEKSKEIEEEIHKHLDSKININSPKQLGAALFEDLGLPKGKKTKTGYSTSAETLESLRNIHPVIDLILQYRTLTKLNSTYCEGLLKLVDKEGRVHSKFNQTETRTGRISSTEPNLQNIPIRTQLGAELRKFFCVEEGNVLIDADYSQIELRLLACIADDEEMKKAFEQGVDIHTVTASQVFNMPIEMVTPLMRSRAKAVNFGIVYGISAFSLASDINVTRKEAKLYIDNYLNHYSGVAKYMENIIKDAKEKGYVETIFNRRRYLPELNSSNFNLRSFGERVALNMPIQGAAADIIKIAMIRVSNRLKNEGLKAKLVLQVHDELIVEAPESEKEKVVEILQTEMKNAVKLKVPLIAEANSGKTWYEAK